MGKRDCTRAHDKVLLFLFFRHRRQSKKRARTARAAKQSICVRRGLSSRDPLFRISPSLSVQRKKTGKKERKKETSNNRKPKSGHFFVRSCPFSLSFFLSFSPVFAVRRSGTALPLPWPRLASKTTRPRPPPLSSPATSPNRPLSRPRSRLRSPPARHTNGAFGRTPTPRAPAPPASWPS